MKIKALLGLALSAIIFAGCSVDEPEADAAEDVVTGPTQVIVTDEDSFVNGASKDGAWIIIFEEDITVGKEVVLEGEFTSKDQPARKLAAYAQDADRNVTERYTVTYPKLTVKSENTRLQGGIYVGDVYVEANGFQVVNATVEGNIYFASEEFKASSSVDENSTVTGSMEVK